ncbi:hypothetical protein SAMN05444349_11087 [Bacteroides faecichinchillae]|uniref:Uncharacterized protein n=1 Tax=Bacteroides faecichinchillae TaxID=871325 RepID=A0A1M4YFJ1_9BACE|nr:hypothetical protein SAMN05444349_11087 [Bacteroides faecichinchillae]
MVGAPFSVVLFETTLLLINYHLWISGIMDKKKL